MSDANLASIAFRPTGSTQFKSLRYTGEDFKNSKETAQSQEIRSDGQIPDLAMVGSQPSGGFNFELSFLALQPFLAGALRAEWQVINLPAITVDLDNATQQVVGLAGDFDDVPVGAMIKITGATTPENNGAKRVVGKIASGGTLVLAPLSLTALEPDVEVDITGKTLANGIVKKSFDFEKRVVNSAGDDFYLRYLGMVTDSLELKIESKKIITGSFKFIGLTNEIDVEGADPEADPVTGPGYDETDAGDIMNGTSNMGSIMMDGAIATDRFKSITLNIANSVRGKDALGYEGNYDVGLGTIAVTGSLNAYFLNNVLPAKIKSHTSFGLAFYIKDAEGNQLHFFLPATKPASGDPTISGINTDVMIETAFQAIMDRATTGKTIIIDAIAAE